MPRIACIVLIALLLVPCMANAKTVITEGMAIIGSDITLEEAKQIALNDARQNALNSLGVFVESQSKVVNYRLTMDEIKTITGAIMTSEIVESKKMISQDVIMLEMKVKFNISMSSLNKTIKNYQDRSKDRRTIRHLIKTIERLQQELVKEEKGTPKTIEIVDEIEFSTKRLGELLTTKQVINYELQIQAIYKRKVKNHFRNNVLQQLYTDIAKALVWEKVPGLSYNKLRLKYIGYDFDKKLDTIKKMIKQKIVNYSYSLESIAEEYDQQNLKVQPKFFYRIEFEIPIYVYVNENKIKNCVNILLFRMRKKNGALCITPQNARWWSGTLSIEHDRIKLPEEVDSWDITLPDIYNLSNIENIEYRIGRINHRDVKFAFFDEKL